MPLNFEEVRQVRGIHRRLNPGLGATHALRSHAIWETELKH